MSGVPAALISMDSEVSAAMQAITCLSINSAMTYGFQLMLAQEASGGKCYQPVLITIDRYITL